MKKIKLLILDIPTGFQFLVIFLKNKQVTKKEKSFLYTSRQIHRVHNEQE